MYIRTYIRPYIHTYIHTVRICTYVYVRTYMFIYTCVSNKGAIHTHMKIPRQPDRGAITAYVRTYVRINTSTYMQRIHCNWHSGADTYEP